MVLRSLATGLAVGLMVGGFMLVIDHAEAAPPAGGLVGFFVREKEGGGTTGGFAPSQLTTAAKVSGISLAAGQSACVWHLNGGQGCAATILGSAVVTNDFRMMGDAGLTLWLSTNAPAPMPFRGLSVTLNRVTAAGTSTAIHTFTTTSSGNTSTLSLAVMPRDSSSTAQNNLVPTLSATPVRVSFGTARFSPLTIRTGETLNLQITAVNMGAASPGTIELYVNYSDKMHSGAIFQALDAGALQLGTKTLGVYLADPTVSFDPPTGTTDKKKAVGSSASANNPTEIVFAAKTLDESLTILSDGVFGISLQPTFGGTAGTQPRLGMEVRLTIGTKVYSGISPYTFIVGAATATPVPIRFTATVPTAGVVVPADTPFKIAVRLFAITGPAGDYEILYGSSLRPSGVHLPVLAEGGGEAPAPSPTETSAATTAATTSSTSASATTTATTSTAFLTSPATTSTAATSSAGTTSAAATNSTAAATNTTSERAGAKNLSEPPETIPGAGVALLAAGLMTLAYAWRRRTR